MSNVLTSEELAQLRELKAELEKRREEREHRRRLGRLGLGPTMPEDNPLFEGGGVVLQGASLGYANSLGDRERAELAALRQKRANSPGGLLAGNEVDRLEWLERTYGTE